MIAAKECVLSVISAVLISSILHKIVPGRITKNWIQLFGKIYIVITLIGHIEAINIHALPNLRTAEKMIAQTYATEGQEIARTQLQDIIKHNVQTYILHQAEQLDLDVTVTVSLSSDELPYPESVTLAGRIPPYKKSLLSSILTEDLGISGEDQIWIG